MNQTLTIGTDNLPKNQIIKIKVNKEVKTILSAIIVAVKKKDFIVDNRSSFNTHRKLVSYSIWDSNFMDCVGEAEGKVAQIVESNIPPQLGSDIIKIDAGIDKLMQMQLLFFETGATLVDHPEICISYPDEISRNSALVLGNVISSFVRHSKLNILSHGYFDSVTFNLDKIRDKYSNDAYVVLRQWEDVAQIEGSSLWRVKLSYVVINFNTHKVDVYNAGCHIVEKQIDLELEKSDKEVARRDMLSYPNIDEEER